MRTLLLGLVVIGLLMGIGFDKGWWSIPPAWNPWEPLRVAAPVTPVTRWKLARLEDDPQACQAILAAVPEARLRYSALADHTPVAGCPLSDVLRLHRAGVAFDRSFIARCPLAVSWLLYERHRLQPVAREVFDQPVVAVEHLGSFACRNVYGREQGRRSDHAAAAALDVAAFRLADGRRIRVQRDWNDGGPAGRFLRRAQRGACGLFGTVLGPDYNAAHADHFHLGLRGTGICR
ncbi:extensin family protein [Halomonas nitroreducens]|uniref:Extensin family protein n=1 Tax=Halomonas nitroreducens TaxID=447425 RepID=A0A3S0JT66_9GAMM|nr:extensin family protein [Halomonas nitroreducens]RTQ97822.1 extensin family protein [Halomonas nitroreducens]